MRISAWVGTFIAVPAHPAQRAVSWRSIEPVSF
jgi:hypothetical protein